VLTYLAVIVSNGITFESLSTRIPISYPLILNDPVTFNIDLYIRSIHVPLNIDVGSDEEFLLIIETLETVIELFTLDIVVPPS
jgi:hypothetical protein